MIGDGFDKAPWRDRTLAFMRRNTKLWERRDSKTFAYTYTELFGYSGMEMYKTLAKHLPHDENGRTDRYCGIDERPEILMRAILMARPKFDLICGDAFVEIPRMLAAGAKLGVIGLDGSWGIREDWWDRHMGLLRTIVSQAIRVCPRPILLLNHTLDLGHEHTVGLRERIRLHADRAAETFAEWRLRETDLLRGTEIVETKRGYVGCAGGFDIYRSAKHEDQPGGTLRMITMRLAFDAAERCTIVDRADVRAPRR